MNPYSQPFVPSLTPSMTENSSFSTDEEFYTPTLDYSDGFIDYDYPDLLIDFIEDTQSTLGEGISPPPGLAKEDVIDKENLVSTHVLNAKAPEFIYSGKMLNSSDPLGKTSNRKYSADHPTHTVKFTFVNSVGSIGHDSGKCFPCAFYYTNRGCANGTDCMYCHECDSSELKRRRELKTQSGQMDEEKDFTFDVIGRDFGPHPLTCGP